LQKLVQEISRRRLWEDEQLWEANYSAEAASPDQNSAQTGKELAVLNCAMDWSEKDLLPVKGLETLRKGSKKSICTSNN